MEKSQSDQIWIKDVSNKSVKRSTMNADKAFRLIGYDVEVVIPKRYRRHIDLMY